MLKNFLRDFFIIIILFHLKIETFEWVGTLELLAAKKLRSRSKNLRYEIFRQHFISYVNWKNWKNSIGVENFYPHSPPPRPILDKASITSSLLKIFFFLWNWDSSDKRKKGFETSCRIGKIFLVEFRYELTILYSLRANLTIMKCKARSMNLSNLQNFLGKSTNNHKRFFKLWIREKNIEKWRKCYTKILFQHYFNQILSGEEWRVVKYLWRVSRIQLFELFFYFQQIFYQIFTPLSLSSFNIESSQSCFTNEIYLYEKNCSKIWFPSFNRLLIWVFIVNDSLLHALCKWINHLYAWLIHLYFISIHKGNDFYVFLYENSLYVYYRWKLFIWKQNHTSIFYNEQIYFYLLEFDISDLDLARLDIDVNIRSIIKKGCKSWSRLL